MVSELAATQENYCPLDQWFIVNGLDLVGHHFSFLVCIYLIPDELCHRQEGD